MNASAEITATYVPDSPQAYWPGDINEDQFVGQADLDIILADWGNSTPDIVDSRPDRNGDNFVGQVDLDTLLADWGKSGFMP